MQQFLYRPTSIGQPSYHRRSLPPVLPGLLLSLPLDGLRQFFDQAFMRSNKTIIAAKPFQVLHQLGSELSRSPDAPSEFGNTLPEGETHAFHKRSVYQESQSPEVKKVKKILRMGNHEVTDHLSLILLASAHPLSCFILFNALSSLERLG